MNFSKRYILCICLAVLSQISNCQVVSKSEPAITTGIMPSKYNTKIIQPSPTTDEENLAKTESTSSAETYVNYRVNSKLSNTGRQNGNVTNTNHNMPYRNTTANANNQFFNTTDNSDSYLNNTTVVQYDKNTNWTTGYGTHYANLVNHERTVWPMTYTVAVSLAVWNKEDVCWKKLKIRNRKKPEYIIEAYIVDFCPIGHCQWADKYLARNVDIYGEKAWNALGADINDSKLELEIEWPKGVVPHDAISTSLTKIDKTLMAVVAPLISTLFALYLF
ncbi:hypothetical protein PIROE2DRAFT_60927 [Piromyces sp. E2]|nr:hypothetical protein PIROE2DRAFT_60927 [Piromyces sp. E2]|eukprot:OUM64060.1 hypothetical protein PIROE2DRAFT_60927 [Piromyces sp. E2]